MSKQAAITQSVSQADVPKDSNDMIITKGKIGKREGNQSQLDEEEQKWSLALYILLLVSTV